MRRHGDALLIVACAVVGLTILFARDHATALPAQWLKTESRSVSLGFTLHMAELQFRRAAAALGRIVSVG